jgi:putative transposase
MLAIAVGGVADHVHVLLSLPRTISVAKAVQLLRGGSSKWLNENYPESGRFAWQEGYAAFSVCLSQREKTVAYIQGQTEHHRRVSFADEFRKFLAAHGITPEEVSVVPSGT